MTQQPDRDRSEPQLSDGVVHGIEAIRRRAAAGQPMKSFPYYRDHDMWDAFEPFVQEAHDDRLELLQLIDAATQPPADSEGSAERLPDACFRCGMFMSDPPDPCPASGNRFPCEREARAASPVAESHEGERERPGPRLKAPNKPTGLFRDKTHSGPVANEGASTPDRVHEPAPAASPVAESGQQVVREIRGRLFEAAWRQDGREWLDPKVTSAILDDVEASALAAAAVVEPSGSTHAPPAAELDVERLGTAMHNVGVTLCDNGGPGSSLDDVAAEYARLSRVDGEDG